MKVGKRYQVRPPLGWTKGDLSLATVIRPLVGLYPRQATANFRYFLNTRNTLLEANPNMRPTTAEKRAAELARKYAEKQHRYRAMNIARNELAVAYREGERLTVEQAQESGLLGPCERVWIAARDERVCGICRAMNGRRAKEGESFTLPNGRTTYTTQGHITCRCTSSPFLRTRKRGQKRFLVKKPRDFKTSEALG